MTTINSQTKYHEVLSNLVQNLIQGDSDSKQKNANLVSDLEWFFKAHSQSDKLMFIQIEPSDVGLTLGEITPYTFSDGARCLVKILFEEVAQHLTPSCKTALEMLDLKDPTSSKAQNFIDKMVQKGIYQFGSPPTPELITHHTRTPGF